MINFEFISSELFGVETTIVVRYRYQVNVIDRSKYQFILLKRSNVM